MLHFSTYFDGYGFGSRFGVLQAVESDFPLALPGDENDVYGFAPLSRGTIDPARILPDDIPWDGCGELLGDPCEGLPENAGIAEVMAYLGIS